MLRIAMTGGDLGGTSLNCGHLRRRSRLCCANAPNCDDGRRSGGDVAQLWASPSPESPALREGSRIAMMGGDLGGDVAQLWASPSPESPALREGSRIAMMGGDLGGTSLNCGHLRRRSRLRCANAPNCDDGRRSGRDVAQLWTFPSPESPALREGSRIAMTGGDLGGTSLNCGHFRRRSRLRCAKAPESR